MQQLPFASEMPQGGPQANFNAPQRGMQQGMPQGFAGGMPQGMQRAPQRRNFAGQQGGMPQMNGSAQQFQGMPQQQSQMGMPQGNVGGPQGGMPQMNAPVQQIQAMPPQQSQMGMPQGDEGGQQMMPQGQLGSQGPEGGRDLGSIAQRIADQVTGLPELLGNAQAAPNAAPAGRPLPSIMIGSLMTIGGQQLGDARGTVQLIVNNSPIQLEIVEWSANGAKVRIPGNLPAGVQAQIEILRADGSVVAKDQVQLAAGQKMAAN